VRPQPPFTSSARRAGARVNSKQRVCVRERVYSFLKRDVVRRTEEQSSLLCPQLPPSPPSLTFQFRLPVWLLPRRRPWRGKAERRVCAAKLRKSFEFACARVGWIVLVSVCTCVCCVRNESIWFPILWCITGETPLFCVSGLWEHPQGASGLCCNQDGIRLFHPVFTVFLTFPRVVPQRRRVVVSVNYPPPSAGRGHGGTNGERLPGVGPSLAVTW